MDLTPGIAFGTTEKLTPVGKGALTMDRFLKSQIQVCV
ncbi:MAG: hypothetical protein ACI8P9_005535, partial [Parasphingorhabdus sp.]